MPAPLPSSSVFSAASVWTLKFWISSSEINFFALLKSNLTSLIPLLLYVYMRIRQACSRRCHRFYSLPTSASVSRTQWEMACFSNVG